MQRLSPSEQSEIIHLCGLHEEKHRFLPYYSRSLVLRSWFIKYGGHGDLEFEYKTQEYLWSMTNGQQNAPRIPQIIDYFSPKEQWAYLVTERIDPILPANTSPQAVATAIQWLRSVPRPSGLTLGSVGGGRARHKLFKNFKAPLSFSSAEGLQKYMNLALQRIHPRGRPANMNFLNDRLIFTQSDMDESNFALDEHQRVCMFDFRDVGVLPESFASYTLGGSTNPFIKSVAMHLDWVNDRNRGSMARAGAILQTSSDATLGLTSSLV